MINQIKKVLQSSELVQGMFLFLAWLVVWQIGRLVEYTEHASVWFPAAGFTFSCFMVLGRRAFLPIMFGAIVITIWNGNHYQLPLTLNELIWAGFLFGLAHILPYWLGASWIRKISQAVEHSVPKLIISFLLVAGVSALITTCLVISSLVLTNQMEISDVSKTLLPFWVGDTAGIVVLAPLLSGLLICISPSSNLDLSDFTKDGIGSFKNLLNKMTLNIFLIFITMTLAYIFDSQESAFAIFFLAVTHMWIATTESPILNVVSLAVSSLLIVLLVHFFGLMSHVMVYQFALVVIAANALFGMAIPQLKAYNRELEHMVFTDSLTQVSSRQYLVQRAELEINQCHDQKSILTLVLFDLDNFKLINDQLGHINGDIALKKVCQMAKTFLSKNDVIARFGGDEFILLFPKLDIKSVQKIVEKIRIAIKNINLKNAEISSSFGISELQVNESFNSLIKRADKALYLSKKNGGNQINLALT